MESSNPKARMSEAVCTEDEVRKAFIAYLIDSKGYSEGLIRKEFGLSRFTKKGRQGKRSRRLDILIWKNDQLGLVPWLLIECKKKNPSQAAHAQLFGYNMQVRAKWCALVWKDGYSLFQGVTFSHSGTWKEFPLYSSL